MRLYRGFFTAGFRKQGTVAAFVLIRLTSTSDSLNQTGIVVIATISAR